MKVFFFIVLGLLLSIGGFYAGVLFESSKSEYKSEAFIGKEVALLEQYADVPKCEQAQRSPNQFNVEKSNGAFVIWRYENNNDRLQRYVINESFDAGYEAVDRFTAQCVD
jgi:hypothetical protein